MIELLASKVVDDFAILEVVCAADISQNIFIRFIRAKVSIENLLPASSILRSSRELGGDSASLTWKAHASVVKAHLSFVRAALDMMDVPYEFKSRESHTGVGYAAGRQASTKRKTGSAIGSS